MALDQFHPLCDSEIAKVPRKPYVVVLFQIQIPIHAESATDLRKGLVRAKGKFPGASHFAIEVMDDSARGIAKRLHEVKQSLKLVRTGAFVGSKS